MGSESARRGPARIVPLDVDTRHQAAHSGRVGPLMKPRDIAELDQARLVLQEQANELAEASARLVVERERLRQVLSATRLGLWEWDVRTGETAFDERWGEIIGHTTAEMQAGNVEELAQCHPDDRQKCRDAIQALMDGRADSYDIEVRMRHKDGRWIWVRDRGQVIERTAAGQPLRMTGTHEDITELAMARESLKEERSRLRETIDGQMDPVMLLDPILAESEGITDFTVVEANVRAAEELGVDFAVLIGAPLSTVLPERAHRFWLIALGDVVNTGDALALDDLPDPGVSGRFFDVRALRVGLGVSITWRDVTERHQAAEVLANRARHDQLTGLLNRAAVFDEITTILGHTPRTGHEVTVAFCDLDAFKDVNDNHGHQTGDNVLRTFAKHLQGMLREDDTVARLGGDEFLLVLRGVHDLDSAFAVAEKVRRHCAELHDYGGVGFTPRISVGVTLLHPGEDADELIARADRAMYRAKTAGGNRVVAI